MSERNQLTVVVQQEVTTRLSVLLFTYLPI